jgi:hypothetical protein
MYIYIYKYFSSTAIFVKIVFVLKFRIQKTEFRRQENTYEPSHDKFFDTQKYDY